MELSGIGTHTEFKLQGCVAVTVLQDWGIKSQSVSREAARPITSHLQAAHT